MECQQLKDSGQTASTSSSSCSDNTVIDKSAMECRCEIEYAASLSHYYKEGCKVLSDNSEKYLRAKLKCYVKDPKRDTISCIGHFNVDEVLLNKLPDTLQRFLPIDFRDHFVPSASFEVFNIEQNVDDERHFSKMRNVYSSDNYDEEITAFTFDSKIKKEIAFFYFTLNSLIAMTKDTLPSPLTMCIRYADVLPPPECNRLKDWRGFCCMNKPTRKLVVVSEACTFEQNGPRQYLLFTPKRLSECIVSNFKRAQRNTYCEIFRNDYDVTCIPFDIDVTGMNATRNINDATKLNNFVTRCVDELRDRLNKQLRRYLNGKFDVRKWPMGIYRGRSNKANKLSLHLYQRLPGNISIRGIDHVKILATRMNREIKRSKQTFSTSGTLLGHWEYTDRDKIYESQIADNHATLRDINDDVLLKFDPSKLRFIPYIDTKIYRVNGSLRLPGCCKSKSRTNVIVKINDEDIHERDIIDSLVHYSHSSEYFEKETIRIECYDDKLCIGSSRHIFVKDVDVERIRRFIENDLKIAVTRCKQTTSGIFFDTELTRCPFAEKDHGNARQFFAYSSSTRVLVQKCWHSNCQGKTKVIDDVHRLTTS